MSQLTDTEANELWAALEVAGHRAALYEATERLRKIAELHLAGPAGRCRFDEERMPCQHRRLVVGNL